MLKNFNEDEVIESLNEVYSGYQYLLLDEIQNLSNWELWVNKLHRRGINLLVTGSNARLLSREMATSLTGRYIQITVFPFSFLEYLNCKKFPSPSQQKLTPKKMGEFLNEANEYMTNGGYPEVIMNPLVGKNYLSTLFDSVLMKDIVRRFNVRRTQQLYELSHYLLVNYTNPYSYNQIKTSLDLSSVATIQKFMGYLSEPYLFQSLTRYSHKLKIQQRAPKKSYIIDNGFIKARSFELSPNHGKLLENLVLVELLRRGFQPEVDLFYYRTRNDREVDFVCRKGHSVVRLIQVCYDLSNTKTLKRETDALLESATELSCFDLMLITWNQEEIMHFNNINIRLIPAWKWLLDSKNRSEQIPPGSD